MLRLSVLFTFLSWHSIFFAANTFNAPMSSSSSTVLIMSNDQTYPWFSNTNLMGSPMTSNMPTNASSVVTAEICMIEAGTITFTSQMYSESESSDNRFIFYIDGVKLIEYSDGGTDPPSANTTKFNLSVGYHTLKWLYTDRGSSSNCWVNVSNISIFGAAQAIDPNIRTSIQRVMQNQDLVWVDDYNLIHIKNDNLIKNSNIMIFDVFGNLVLSEKINKNTFSLKQPIISGIYLIKCGNSSQKIMLH